MIAMNTKKIKKREKVEWKWFVNQKSVANITPKGK